MKKENFIGNTLTVEKLAGANRYIVTATYEAVQEDGSFELIDRVIEDITMSSQEIEEEGGLEEISRQLEECYNLIDGSELVKSRKESAGNKEDRIFLKNILDSDVDGLQHTITYTVKAMYDVKQPGGYYKLVHVLLDKSVLKWDEIDKLGGPGKVMRDIKNKYNIAE